MSLDERSNQIRYRFFDSEFYYQTHQDLRKNGVNTKEKILHHFIYYGIKEGRKFRLNEGLDFDASFYLNTYRDLGVSGITNYKLALYHFFMFGVVEGRVCCAKQMTENYRRNWNEATCETHLQTPNKRGGVEDKIHILIRTSGRPKAFEKCIQSILVQKYKNYHVFVCYDKENSLNYLCKYKDHADITYFPVSIRSAEKYKFNLYCNVLMEKVEKGYIMFLDDDDILLHNNVLTIINNYLHTYKVVIWSFLRPDKLITPQNINQKIVLGEIDTACVCFDKALKGSAVWDDKQYGDFRFYSQLLNPLNKKWVTHINTILTGTQNNDKIGNWGENKGEKEEKEEKEEKAI